MSAVATIGHNSVSSWRASQPGVSEAAKRIDSVVRTVVAGFVASATGQRRLGDPLGAIDSIYNECRQANWDGEGALPISLTTCEEAEQLLLLLPTSVPVPEFLPEPSGRIAFEWHKSAEVVYVLSTGGTKELEFAGLFGRGNEIYGKCSFSEALPSMILDHLREFQRR